MCSGHHTGPDGLAAWCPPDDQIHPAAVVVLPQQLVDLLGLLPRRMWYPAASGTRSKASQTPAGPFFPILCLKVQGREPGVAHGTAVASSWPGPTLNSSCACGFAATGKCVTCGQKVCAADQATHAVCYPILRLTVMSDSQQAVT